MIQFKSRNVDGEIRSWVFESYNVIQREWLSENCDLPANDDEIWDVIIDHEDEDLVQTRLEGTETNKIWFKDLLVYLGIWIWR